MVTFLAVINKLQGYILGLHRIRIKTSSSSPADASFPVKNQTFDCEGSKKSKGAVLFVHGFLQCSEAFIARNQGKSLPYILAEQGYFSCNFVTLGTTYGLVIIVEINTA